MSVGVRKEKGKWVDKAGRRLPEDNLVIHKDDAKLKKAKVDLFNETSTTRIVNPDVARDNKNKSFTFGRMSALAAKRVTNKRFKNKKA